MKCAAVFFMYERQIVIIRQKCDFIPCFTILRCPRTYFRTRDSLPEASTPEISVLVIIFQKMTTKSYILQGVLLLLEKLDSIRLDFLLKWLSGKLLFESMFGL